jgi:hypothetical protein
MVRFLRIPGERLPLQGDHGATLRCRLCRSAGSSGAPAWRARTSSQRQRASGLRLRQQPRAAELGSCGSAAGARAAGCAELLELAVSGWQQWNACAREGPRTLVTARSASAWYRCPERCRSDGRLESSMTVAAALTVRWPAVARRRLSGSSLPGRPEDPGHGNVGTRSHDRWPEGMPVRWPGKPGRNSHRKRWRFWCCCC